MIESKITDKPIRVLGCEMWPAEIYYFGELVTRCNFWSRAYRDTWIIGEALRLKRANYEETIGDLICQDLK